MSYCKVQRDTRRCRPQGDKSRADLRENVATRQQSQWRNPRQYRTASRRPQRKSLRKTARPKRAPVASARPLRDTRGTRGPARCRRRSRLICPERAPCCRSLRRLRSQTRTPSRCSRATRWSPAWMKCQRVREMRLLLEAGNYCLIL